MSPGGFLLRLRRRLAAVAKVDFPQVGAVVDGRFPLLRGTVDFDLRFGRGGDVPVGVLVDVLAAPAVLGEQRFAHVVELLELLLGGGLGLGGVTVLVGILRLGRGLLRLGLSGRRRWVFGVAVG